jgi:hypothetical protein
MIREMIIECKVISGVFFGMTGSTNPNTKSEILNKH